MPKLSVQAYIARLETAVLPPPADADAVFEQVEVLGDHDYRTLSSYLGHACDWDVDQMRALVTAYRALNPLRTHLQIEQPEYHRVSAHPPMAPHLNLEGQMANVEELETEVGAIQDAALAWQEFQGQIPQENICRRFTGEAMVSALGAAAQVEVVEVVVRNHTQPRPSWYPIGEPSEKDGHTYVEQQECRVGVEPMWLAEASCCVLTFLVNRDSGECFSAHIDATSGEYLRQMHEQLVGFVNRLDDVPELYLFSTGVNDHSSYELDNVMALLNSVFTPDLLSLVAQRTHMVGGQGGHNWNAYSSVRYNPQKEVPLDVQFAQCF